jgi:hypothetical protein
MVKLLSPLSNFQWGTQNYCQPSSPGFEFLASPKLELVAKSGNPATGGPRARHSLGQQPSSLQHVRSWTCGNSLPLAPVIIAQMCL